MELHLLESQLLNLLRSIGARNIIFGRHRGEGSRDADGLGGVGREIDDAVTDAEAVIVGSFGASLSEVELTAAAEFRGVEKGDVVDAHVLEIEGLTAGIGDGASDGEVGVGGTREGSSKQQAVSSKFYVSREG